MRWIILCITMALLIALIGNAQALYYKERPDVVASFIGSNHFERGETKDIMLLVYNPAKQDLIDYDDTAEAAYFSGREYLIFMAYNVSFELEGNDYIEVKTPKQLVPALKAMEPTQLSFKVKIKDDAKAGKYVLNLKVSYDRINDIDITSFTPLEILTQIKKSDSNVTKTYEYIMYLNEVDTSYTKVEKTIPVTIYIEKEDVKLEIVDIKTENLQAKGKGKITVQVKNIGEETGKSAYLVLTTPQEFEAKNTLLSLTTEQLKPLLGFLQMQMRMQGGDLFKSIPQLSLSMGAIYVGDLNPSQTANATFTIKVNTKEEGNYPFQIKAVYLDEYGNAVESEPVSFGVYVEPAPKFGVLDIESNVLVNAKGDVKLSITCDKNVEEVSASLKASPPLSALSSEYYIGDLDANEITTAVFKVKASGEAKPVVYPAEIVFKYKINDEWVDSDPIKIGIKVNPKIKFEVVGVPEIAAGEEKVVTVTIKNTGGFTIKEATARITIVDPFTSTDDTAYIGTLEPNESRKVSFKIKANKEATPKLYGLNLEVKYKDLEDEWAISEPVKMEIRVTPAKPSMTMFVVIAIIVVAAIAYALRKRR